MPRYEEAVPSRFALQPRVPKGQTMRKLGSVLVLCAATVCLSGCAWRNLGPCYGMGCPTFMMSKSAPPPSGTAQNAASAKSAHGKNAQAAKAQTAQTPTNPGQ
jgi:hypothetical protein